MEFFLLAVVSRAGLRSLYELQQAVGLQPGGIQPVLRHLEEDGLLKRSEQGRRRRRVIEVTDKGKLLLARYWRDCLRDYSDMESISRCATVALLTEHAKQAYEYLMGIADIHEQAARDLPAEYLQTQPQSPIEWYALMRTAWETQRHKALANTLRSVATQLQKT